jgi:hypothetical protein
VRFIRCIVENASHKHASDASFLWGQLLLTRSLAEARHTSGKTKSN